MKKQIELKELLEGKMSELEPLEETKDYEAIERDIPRNLMFDATATDFVPEMQTVTSFISKGGSIEETKRLFMNMKQFIDEELVERVDYGVIPRCSKPTLLKSGAEKIMNYLGLISRTSLTHRVENYDDAYFSYEVKVTLLDEAGIVKGEGVGICNSREKQYANNDAYNVANTLIKMAKKRALVDAVLNVAGLSNHFTQDVEDGNVVLDDSQEKDTANNVPNTNRNVKPMTQKQLAFLNKLMEERGSTNEAMNNYTRAHYGVDDYHNISSYQASQIIEMYKNRR